MSASWLQDRLKKAEELLHAVDRTAAKAVSTETSTRKPGDGEGPLAEPTSTAAAAASLPSRAKSTYQREASKGAAAAAVAAALAAAEQAANRQVPAVTTAAEPAHALVDARSDPVATTPAAAPTADSGVEVAPVAGTEAAASVGQQTEQPLSGVEGDAAAQHAAASSGSSMVGPSSAPASQQLGQQRCSTPTADSEAPAGPAPPSPVDSTDVEAVQTAAEASPAARLASNGQGVESADVQQASEQAENGSGEPSLLPADSTEVSSAGEVQGGSAFTAAQREARLLKMVDQLKRRMERYKAENEQLEEMLKHADAAAHGGSGEISRLEDQLARAQAALISAEAATAQALAAKATELMGLRQQLDAAATRAELAEQRLEELQAANEQFVEERKVSEGQLLQTLRQEVESIERRLDEERAAHTATRKASAAREQQQDATLAESSSSLAAMQRTLEQRSAKLSAAEERCYALEHEVDGLVQQLRAAEAKLKRQLEAAAASSSEVLQQRIGDLEGQLRSAQIGQQQAEQARARADEELVVLRAEVSTVKRQLADAHSVDSSDLQRRLKDVTDMLYLKQTQLERLAADKAAQQLAMERELQQAKTESQQVKRRATMDRSLSAVDESMVPMDTLGDAYTRLANNNRVGGAVKAGAEFIDQTANQFVRILRQYPLGRLVIFCYILGLHLFIYILLHRLQHKAFKAEMAAEAAHRDDRI